MAGRQTYGSMSVAPALGDDGHKQGHGSYSHVNSYDRDDHHDNGDDQGPTHRLPRWLEAASHSHSSSSFGQGLESAASSSGRLAREKVVQWLSHELHPDHMVRSNLVITLSTAMLDAVTFRLFGTFATNQTGNTVFLTLAAINKGEVKLILATVSLAGFFFAGLLFGQLGARFGHRRRGWVLATLLIQNTILALFCFLVSPLAPTIFYKSHTLHWVPMLLAAVQGGPQVVMATNLGVPEIPTAMVTSAYAGLVSDPHLFVWKRSPGRDRRIIYLCIFWAGSFLGLYVEEWSSAWFASSLAAAFKIGAMVVIAFSASA